MGGGDWADIAGEQAERGDEVLVINMGPQHPSTHGVLRLMVECDGETITSIRPGIGFLHTGIEKNMEYRSWTQGSTFVTRMDYVSPPVSYTHLDVYKRQDDDRTMLGVLGVEDERSQRDRSGAWAPPQLALRLDPAAHLLPPRIGFSGRAALEPGDLADADHPFAPAQPGVPAGGGKVVGQIAGILDADGHRSPCGPRRMVDHAPQDSRSPEVFRPGCQMASREHFA